MDICEVSCPDSSELYGAHYCSSDCPCDAGEGDCDSDAECRSGLFCSRDFGERYGKSKWIDICEASCPLPSELNNWWYCSRSCPCDAGEGDCDSDAECRSGVVCSHNVGKKYGEHEKLDVCEQPAF